MDEAGEMCRRQAIRILVSTVESLDFILSIMGGNEKF
jgi:hypothetical protein